MVFSFQFCQVWFGLPGQVCVCEKNENKSQSYDRDRTRHDFGNRNGRVGQNVLEWFGTTHHYQ